MSAYIRPGLKTPDEVIADHFGSTPRDMRSPSRLREDVEARQVAMYYYMKYWNWGPGTAARRFNRNHATANHSIITVENLMETNKVFRKKLDEVLVKLKKFTPEESE